MFPSRLHFDQEPSPRCRGISAHYNVEAVSLQDPRHSILSRHSLDVAREPFAPSGHALDCIKCAREDDINNEVSVNDLYHQQCSLQWAGNDSGSVEGALLRQRNGTFLSCPPGLVDSPFSLACVELDASVIITVKSRVVRTFLACSPVDLAVTLPNGSYVQILPCLADLKKARKHQHAAFIASEGLLAVWDDDPADIVPRAREIERSLSELVWNEVERKQSGIKDLASELWHSPSLTEYNIDPESGKEQEIRRVNFLNSVMIGATIVLIMTMIAGGLRAIVVASLMDKSWLRLAFLALIPFQVFFALFCAQVIVGCFTQVVGPVKQLFENSKYYSALLPRRLTGTVLPHVTIQMPVYKEGLDGVIVPTVKSVKRAIATYELQGGSANIFVNDDGLQILGATERDARIRFYADQGIGWTARPPDGCDDFVRVGKFKKASNMNYGLALSIKVEDRLMQVERHATWSQDDEARQYAYCLEDVLEGDGRAWADGNIRIGDYILLIDSDTRVPSDCLLDAVSELEQCPSVGIMQFSSGVMQVVHTYFENGIAFFTNLIYTSIRYTVSNGDIAPFVGHNAILRWSALQQIAFVDQEGTEKFWSESHVSEDFDMSLRLQCDGYIVRLCTWAGDGFKEGVSLTVYDELNRWEKYAFGCDELLFNPVRLWLSKGPFTALFKRFILSDMAFVSKVTICSYIGTYYAIGAAWLMTTANYFAVGWFNGYLDKYYVDSWKVWISIIVIFNGCGNLALATMRYRSGSSGFMRSLIENFKWTLMFGIFFGGLSLHVSQALLAHMFGIDMTWEATAKEAEFSNFFLEVPRVLRRFKFSMLYAVTMLTGVIILGIPRSSDGRGFFGLIPYDWMITDFVAILPICSVSVSHLLLPIVLNPALMTFSW